MTKSTEPCSDAPVERLDTDEGRRAVAEARAAWSPVMERAVAAFQEVAAVVDAGLAAHKSESALYASLGVFGDAIGNRWSTLTGEALFDTIMVNGIASYIGRWNNSAPGLNLDPHEVESRAALWLGYRSTERCGAEAGPKAADCTCVDRDKAGHDLLLLAETDAYALWLLVEIVSSWGEVDWKLMEVSPLAWGEFAARHNWADPVSAEVRYGTLRTLARDAQARIQRPG